MLKIQAANIGESHVEYQTARTVSVFAAQEFLRGGEILALQANGLQQIPNRFAHACIIIDDEYCWHFFRAHCPHSYHRATRIQTAIPIASSWLQSATMHVNSGSDLCELIPSSTMRCDLRV
jgi:hypothetical protein